MRQSFIQNRQRIEVPAPAWEALPILSEVNAKFCDNVFDVLEGYNSYIEVGG